MLRVGSSIFAIKVKILQLEVWYWWKI